MHNLEQYCIAIYVYECLFNHPTQATQLEETATNDNTDPNEEIPKTPKTSSSSSSDNNDSSSSPAPSCTIQRNDGSKNIKNRKIVNKRCGSPWWKIRHIYGRKSSNTGCLCNVFFFVYGAVLR